ncbi:hypothetical protein C8N24_3659 [Solirubrobacter pauli]|uniref:Uncharacterized protein n=1 Tax=Solirubrobacter pauli TaxID=166793 RepID=A0A660LHG3_9ACTN|nr:DUF5691 domain-containing protein [Solirubrobacter pauli]RKQ93786.1 hypothetical protein C8N24_3659 [Solirubrobacter pauli]
MSWDELVAAALIGTDRRPVEADAPPGSPEALEATLGGRGAEDRLLVASAAWTVARRAGAQAGASRTVEPVAADARPLCSAAAASRLELLLEVRELVDEWLGLADRAGVRPPPELAPALLDYAEARPERQAAVLGALGALAAWLAAREPRWAYALPVDDDVWKTGTPDQRQALLRRRRQEDPEAARALIASTWAEETWEDREAFLGELELGLSEADEPLLETALQDRRKPVRDVAAELLARLPRSAFAARAAAAARPLLRVEDGELVATLPEAEGRGRRSERLTELIAAAPLDVWTSGTNAETAGGDGAADGALAGLGLAPAQLVALPVRDDLAAAVHAGWVEAAINQRHEAWGRALGLLELLPHAEAEARAAAADDPVRAAERLRWTWGPTLSNAVVASVKRRREQGGRDIDVAFVGYRIDPATEVDHLRELGGRDIGRLCDVAAIRAAMLSEFV